jgi:hypothetical protein
MISEQIETFFKKLKQNFPLTYFFGDNSNAVEIQGWCAPMALLLLDVTHKDHNSTMPFSMLAIIIRLHIMNYVALYVFDLRFSISSNEHNNNTEL